MYVACPDLCGTPARPCKFTAKVKGKGAGRGLTYRWEVDKGKIKSGQGSPSITVDVGGEMAYGLTATVEVVGFG